MKGQTQNQTKDKLTKGQTYKRTNLQKYKLTKGQTCERTNSQNVKLTKGQTHKRTNLQTDKLTKGQTYERTNSKPNNRRTNKSLLQLVNWEGHPHTQRTFLQTNIAQFRKRQTFWKGLSDVERWGRSLESSLVSWD